MTLSQDAPGAVTAWLDPLLDTYERALLATSPDAARTRTLLPLRDEIRLAVTVARAATSRATLAAPSPQLIVLGPTQAGKSALVNVLLDSDRAGVSALAGHTVHAQAFTDDVSGSREPACERLAPLLAPLERVAHDALRADRLDAWSCTPVTVGVEALAPPGATVWDTPDFDSIAASAYAEAVIRAAGVADVLVLVTSKDKYGDASVWHWLERLRAIGTPLLVIINKVDAPSRETVRTAFASREAERATAGEPSRDRPALQPLLLPWLDTGAEAGRPRFPMEDVGALTAALHEALRASGDDEARRTGLARFIAARREAWLAPLHVERAARTRWQTDVRSAGRTLIDGYVARYLGDADRYEAFDRTLIELLTLLELPGLARVLSRTRRAVTWPARRLLGLGADLGRHIGQDLGAELAKRGTGGPMSAMAGRLTRDDGGRADRETRVLEDLLDSALTGLRTDVQDAVEQDGADGFWRALDRELAELRAPMSSRWTNEIVAVRDAFQPRIEAAARALYERLQAQPALLNTLRATRVTTDAAGLALAVKSGGLAPADLVLAPAMLSVTTLLTESVLGRYLEGVKRDLKREQRELVDARLVRGLFEPALLALPERSDAPVLLGGGGATALLHELDRPG